MGGLQVVPASSRSGSVMSSPDVIMITDAGKAVN